MLSERMKVIVGGLQALKMKIHGMDEISFMLVHEIPELFSRSANDVIINKASAAGGINGKELKEGLSEIEKKVGKDWGVLMIAIQVGELLKQIEIGEKHPAHFLHFCVKHGVLEDEIKSYLAK
jgi:hypothetical protein